MASFLTSATESFFVNSKHTTPLNQAGQVTILGTLLRLDDAPSDAHHRTRQDFESATRVKKRTARRLQSRLGAASARGRRICWRPTRLDLKQVEGLLDELHA